MRAESPDLPVWVGELYLEYHRGTYTTNGPIKRANRRNEQALRAAELWSVAAMAGPGSALLSGGRARRRVEAAAAQPVPRHHPRLEHPLGQRRLPARPRAHRRRSRRSLIAAAQQTIAEQVDTTGMARPFVVFNAASRDRHELAEIEVDGASKLVPVVGARVRLRGDRPRRAAPTWLARGHRSPTARSRTSVLRVTWDDDGLLTSVFDKEHDREVLAPGARGNLFQLHDDNPREFDAWNVDIDYLDHRVDLTDVSSIEVVERGPLRAGVRFVREFGASTITQTMRLASGSRRLEFDTEVDWHEHHKFLKVAFPVDVHAARATYEIQFGHLERPTHTNTSWDVARFEVCAHRWADLSEPGYGVALLNDCKYGYDIHGNVMRLSLLREPGLARSRIGSGRAPVLVRAVPARRRPARGRRDRRGRGVQPPARRGAGSTGWTGTRRSRPASGERVDRARPTGRT